MSAEVSLFNKDYQYSVLKLLATNTKFAVEYGHLLKQEYFETQPTSVIYSIINRYVNTYEKELTLSDCMVEIDEYISSRGYQEQIDVLLKNEAKQIFKSSISSEQFVIDKLIAFARRASLRQALGHGLDVLESGGNYETVLQMVNDAVSIGYGGDDGLTYEDIKTLPSLYRKRYNPADLIQTGFHSYDHALEGGMAPGEVHLVQSPPKTGKSTLAPNFGLYSLALGKAIYHVTLEISDLDVMAKYGVRMSGHTYQEMKLSRDEEFGSLIASKFDKYQPKLFVKYWTPLSINALAIRSWISKLRSKYNAPPDLIILDYDDLLLPTGGSKDDMYNDASMVYFDLKGLADYFKCPILTFAQPRREAWELMEKGQLIHSYHLAHSAKKVMQCFSISSLNFRKDSDSGILFVDLNRRGRSNVKIPIVRDLERGRIKENLPTVNRDLSQENMVAGATVEEHPPQPQH